MKKVILLLCLTALIMGCVSLTATRVTSDNRENLSKLSVGMSHSKALTIMGRNPVTLKCPDAASRRTREATIANPYRTEVLPVADKKLEVVYYAIDINNDCTVSEDGLMPLVFEDHKLIGWGKDFLESAKNKTSPNPASEQAAAPVTTLTPLVTPVPVEIPAPIATPVTTEAPVVPDKVQEVTPQQAPAKDQLPVVENVAPEIKPVATPVTTETPVPAATPATEQTPKQAPAETKAP